MPFTCERIVLSLRPVQQNDIQFEDIDDDVLRRFRDHDCRCRPPTGGRFGPRAHRKAVVPYAAGRLSVEVNARGLLAHRDTEYEEWGFSGSIAYTPSADGRGLSMRLGSAWGATQSGVQSLWSRQDASGLVRNAAFEAAQRYQVELRYGLDGKTGRARWEPFVGVESGEGASRALRLGVKLTSGRRLDAGLELGQRQGRPGADPEQAVQLRGALRW